MSSRASANWASITRRCSDISFITYRIRRITEATRVHCCGTPPQCVQIEVTPESWRIKPN
jgi:hypothetical protein